MYKIILSLALNLNAQTGLFTSSICGYTEIEGITYMWGQYWCCDDTKECKGWSIIQDINTRRPYAKVINYKWEQVIVDHFDDVVVYVNKHNQLVYNQRDTLLSIYTVKYQNKKYDPDNNPWLIIGWVKQSVDNMTCKDKTFYNLK